MKKSHAKLAMRSLAVSLTALTGASVVVAASWAQKAPSLPPYLAAFPEFAPRITPQMPGDVDIALKEKLEKNQQFPLVQREFDLNAWQMFLSLQWPTNNQGQAAPTLTDTAFGEPHWTLWHNSSTIFQTDGAKPAACGGGALRAMALTRDMTKPVSKGLMAFSPAATAGTNPRSTRFLGVISAVGELNVAKLEEISQAFSGPMIDQNGQFVFYEIMIDPNEVGYLCDNSLYNINGQVAFTKGGGKVDMPHGTPNADWSGSYELKFAWKIIGPKDDASRFYTTPAVVMDQGPNGQPIERKVTVGLVGMHIGHKSETSPQWIWATFEQVDNLAVDNVAHPNLNPSFFDPNCPICTVDQQPQQGSNGAYPRVPTQAWRTIPIPPDKLHLNQEAQAVLAKMGSIWQYYQLIDTQWPTGPRAKPANPLGQLPDPITNKSGGDPTPVYLTNITMETYFQGGNEPACNGMELPGNVNCPANPTTWTSPQNNKPPPIAQANSSNVFVSESCMGCHSSAGVYTSYNPTTQQGTTSGQLTGDFSWLLTQKASWQQ
ncbi:MAG TPA: hypothetical protein VGG29_08005 [Caulobacteraceae bacterium]|jgi:hypothetical protein